MIDIDQSPIGRTPRSNPATYTNLFGPIRDLMAQVPEARMRGYGPGRFSFNVKGGRCEACGGGGQIAIEMHFLPDVYVTCDVCGGHRYNRETLEVRYKGLNIAEVLDLTAEQAAEVFANVPSIRNVSATLVEVGLGYIKLGQPATTLSGGEAQRVKLARELAKRATGRTLYILDEPTTGLHFDDVRKLLDRPPRPRRPGEHGHRHRAQPRRRQDGRPDRRPGTRKGAPGEASSSPKGPPRRSPRWRPRRPASTSPRSSERGGRPAAGRSRGLAALESTICRDHGLQH